MKQSDKRKLYTAVQHYHSSVAVQADYLKGRGITGEVALKAKLGVVTDPLPGHEDYEGMLAIPYLTPSGPVDIRFRNLSGEGPKYLTQPGRKARLYNVQAVIDASDSLHITEGELDALILTYRCGFPAVGIAGAAQWKPHYPRIFQDFQNLYVWGDGDSAGREFAKHVAKETGATIVHLPDGHDVTSLFTEQGVEGTASLIGL